ncbi:MAG: hypothetical protein U0L09_04465 [Christensenellales bacterium]|nr:hypothetical protein [Christensenellales bacterium]
MANTKPTEVQEVNVRILKDEAKRLATIWLTTDEADVALDGVIAAMKGDNYRVAIVRSGRSNVADGMLPLLKHNR